MKEILARLFTKPARADSRRKPGEPAPVSDAAELPEAATPAPSGLLGNVDEMMFVLDGGGRLAALSTPLLTLLGMREHEALGRPAEDLFQGSPGWLAGSSRATVHFQCGAGTPYGAIVAMSSIPVGKDQQEFRLALLSRVGVENASGPSSDKNRSAAELCSAADFSVAVKALLRTRQGCMPLTAGRIEVIGLQDVKTALGVRWPALAVRARSLARSVLERRLAPEDIFSEIPDDRYLICFGSLAVADARLKAGLIAGEIRERLLSESDTTLTVESQVEEFTLRAADMGDGIDLLPGLMRMMDDARDMRCRADETHLATLLRSATLRLQPVLNRSLSETGLMIAGLGADCAPWLMGGRADDETPKLVFELNLLLVGLVNTYICALPSGCAPAIVVPVSYITLHERRYLDDYLDLCRSIDSAARNRILFEVRGVTMDVPDLRLQELLSRLAPFSAHRLLRVSGLDHRFLDLNRFRLAMLTIDAEHANLEDPSMQRKFRGLVAMVRGSASPGKAHASGCRLLVHGVRDEGDARRYCAQGADCIALAGTDTAPAADGLRTRASGSTAPKIAQPR